MRTLVDAGLVTDFISGLGREAKTAGRVYLTGGATAVLFGWRSSTVDVDLKLIPESEALFRAITRLKESLNLNVELAAPDQFIPMLPGWEQRSRFIAREGTLDFFHYDFYGQALAKLERGFVRDLLDVDEMKQRGLIHNPELISLFDAIEPELFRYPSIDSPGFRVKVEAFVASSP
jgi:hypothetical protein